MRKLLLLVAFTVLLSAVATPSAQSRPANRKEPFIRAWKLARLEEPDAAGKIQRADCNGLLVFTRDGHMSVQVMYRNAQPKEQAGPVQYAQGGYEASFGTYQINDARTFTFHVDGAMVRSLIGKDLPRSYEFVGKQLIVKSTDAKEHWKVAWEHF